MTSKPEARVRICIIIMIMIIIIIHIRSASNYVRLCSDDDELKLLWIGITINSGMIDCINICLVYICRRKCFEWKRSSLPVISDGRLLHTAGASCCMTQCSASERSSVALEHSLFGLNKLDLSFPVMCIGETVSTRPKPRLRQHWRGRDEARRRGSWESDQGEAEARKSEYHVNVFMRQHKHRTCLACI